MSRYVNKKNSIVFASAVLLFFIILSLVGMSPSVDKPNSLYKENFERTISSFINSDGTFTSQRFDRTIIDGDIVGTYYTLRTQRLLGNEIDNKMEKTFSKKVINEIKTEPNYIFFVDYLIEYHVLSEKEEKDLLDILNTYYQNELKEPIEKRNPYLVYALTKTMDRVRLVSLENKEETLKTIEHYIHSNPDSPNIELNYWYFDLNNGVKEASYSENFEHLDAKQFEFSPLELFYSFSILKDLNKNPNYLSIISTIKADLENTLSPEDIYYKLKIISLSNMDKLKEYKQFYSDFFLTIPKQNDDLFPRYVIEHSNIIEQIISEIVIEKIYNEKPLDLIDSSDFMDWERVSRTELYFGILYLTLNKQNIPLEAKRALERYRSEGEITDNYYVYKGYKLLNYNLSTEELNRLKAELESYIEMQDPWYSIHALDLLQTYTTDENFTKIKLNEIQTWLDDKIGKHNETFFIAQKLKYELGIILNVEEIDKFYRVKTIDNLTLITGDRGEMDLYALYQYSILKELIELQKEPSKTKDFSTFIEKL